jgi:hypothetical protein
MSEATAVTEAPVSKVPSEVTDQINKEHAIITKMNKVELITKAKELGMNFDPETTNEKWLARKLKYAVQAAILAQHGLTETPAVKKNREKLEASDPTSPASVGRKRMATTGNFVLSLGEGGKEGRANSTKGKIVAAMKEKGTFTYADFKQSVCDALQWNEESLSFGGDTRFKTLDLATGAWWSELKNKAKIIVEAPTA